MAAQNNNMLFHLFFLLNFYYLILPLDIYYYNLCNHKPRSHRDILFIFCSCHERGKQQQGLYDKERERRRKITPIKKTHEILIASLTTISNYLVIIHRQLTPLQNSNFSLNKNKILFFPHIKFIISCQPEVKKTKKSSKHFFFFNNKIKKHFNLIFF